MNEEDVSDDDSVNNEIQVACREALGLQKEKTLLTIAEFYAPTPEVLNGTTGWYYFFTMCASYRTT